MIAVFALDAIRVCIEVLKINAYPNIKTGRINDPSFAPNARIKHSTDKNSWGLLCPESVAFMKSNNERSIKSAAIVSCLLDIAGTPSTIMG